MDKYANSSTSPTQEDEAQRLDALGKTDWAAVWRVLQIKRRVADDAAYWDERSKTFGANDKPNDYAQRFLELANVKPGESVFDMGCGNGALALPLAAAGHEVLAVDFSRGMLDRLEHDAARRNVTGITTKLASWDDDWKAAGILPNSHDVAFASRSIATADLKDSLLRLNAVARRKCCITLATSYSPRCDEAILRAIGFDALVGRDFWYAVNILMQMGMLPDVRYIESARFDAYESREEAWENVLLMLENALKADSAHDAADARKRLRAWFDENLSLKPHAGKDGQDVYMFAQPRVVTWAFISWDVRE